MSRCPRAWLVASALALGVSLAASHPAIAADPAQPLWEVGLGAGVLGLSDYRGAASGRVYPVPVPYFVYRGRLLKADRSGLHGLLAGGRHAELKLNVGATTPVHSNASSIRSGMPGLASTLELGPAVDLHLWRSGAGDARLDLRLPLDAAVTVDAAPRFVGWQFVPRLNLDILNVGGHAGWNLGVLAGPLYADRGYHDYFYGVAPRYATASRPAYSARGGYAGAQLLVAFSRRFPQYWVGGFLRRDWLGSAVFADSPLVRSHGYWMGGAGIAWLIGRSRQSAAAADEWLP